MRYGSVWLAACLLMLPNCARDPLSVIPGGQGDIVIFATGVDGAGREVCVQAEGQTGCETVLTVRDPVALTAEWLNDREVEVFVAGGRIMWCAPRASTGALVKLHQRQSTDPESLADHRSAEPAFRRAPDTCADYSA